MIFNTKAFVISNVAGINPIPPSEPKNVSSSCAACHSQHFDGSQSFPSAQQDQGIGGDSAAFNGPQASPFLPIFRVTCKPGSSAGFHGAGVTTNDPGKALISGKCADVGKFTVPQLRALAARAPYFSDGSAATLLDVVNFYDKRFSINLSPAREDGLGQLSQLLVSILSSADLHTRLQRLFIALRSLFGKLSGFGLAPGASPHHTNSELTDLPAAHPTCANNGPA